MKIIKLMIESYDEHNVLQGDVEVLGEWKVSPKNLGVAIRRFNSQCSKNMMNKYHNEILRTSYIEIDGDIFLDFPYNHEDKQLSSSLFAHMNRYGIKEGKDA